MPYATVNSGAHRVRLHYELLVGANAWDELILAQDQLPVAEGPEAQGETAPLSRRWSLAEKGGVEGCEGAAGSASTADQHAPTCQERVLFIPGLAAKKCTEYFEQQVRCVTALKGSAGEPLACVCVFANRGVGRSSVPQLREHYTTDIMCRDVIGLLDHLGWDCQVHVVGQSLGALIALKLAAAVPGRLKSVTITGGVLSGAQLFWSGMRNAPRLGAQFFLGGLRSKIMSNLQMQYTKEYLAETTDNGQTRLDTLAEKQEAEIRQKRGTVPVETRRRNMTGRRGQLRATIWHRMSGKEIDTIAQADHFRVAILHGWQDRFISSSQAFQLGSSLRAVMVTTEAAHAGIGIEAAAMVNQVVVTQLQGGYPVPRAQKAEHLQSRGAGTGQVFHLHATSGRTQHAATHSQLVKRVQTLP